jgi:hypothetical protein
MAWWKWHQGGDQDLQDPVGPAIMYDAYSGRLECESGSVWADEPTCEFQLTRGLIPELVRQAASTPRSCVRLRADK